MRSLYSGVAGMKTHQTKMDVIGNNIANVNTVAFKSSSVTFSELMYQTTQSASGANETTGTAGINANQIGLGVSVGAINTSIESAGADQSTGNPFDVKIAGDSFFVVSDGSNNFFTRAGAFYVDGNGNLAMSSNGYNVMGWGTNEDASEIKQDTVIPLRVMGSDNMTYPPESTTEAYVSGIIDKNDTDVNSATGKMMNLKIYDNLGYSYTAKLCVKATSETPATGQYSVELVDLLDANNGSVMGLYPDISLGGGSFVQDKKTLTLASSVDNNALENLKYKDVDGVEQTVNLLTGFDPTNAGGMDDVSFSNMMDEVAKLYGLDSGEELLNMTVDVKDDQGVVTGANTPIGALTETNILKALHGDGTVEDPVEVSGRNFTGCVVEYDINTGKFSTINGNEGATSITLNLNGNGQYNNFSDVNVDFKTSSMYDNSGTSTVGATNGTTDGLGKGRRLGELSGISIQSNGMIYASYDNGMNRLLGQIAVANFSNPSGLEKVGDNLYAASLNSGEFDGIGEDVSANGGAMKTGTLEMSNVDLSQEFTEMITTQRGFQANSRIITVSDTLLEELVNLKR